MADVVVVVVGSSVSMCVRTSLRMRSSHASAIGVRAHSSHSSALEAITWVQSHGAGSLLSGGALEVGVDGALVDGAATALVVGAAMVDGAES